MSDKESLEDLRCSLKKWEAAFVVVHQRKPNKEDLSNAPPNIREKYRLYHAGKKGPQSKLNTMAESPVAEHCDHTEVWSSKLNKKHQKCHNDTKKEHEDTSQDLLGKLGAKLFHNAKASQSTSFAIKKKQHGMCKQMHADENLSEAHNQISTSPDQRSDSCANMVEMVDKKTADMKTDQTSAKTSPNPVVEDFDLVVKGGIFKGAEKFLRKTSSGLTRATSHQSLISKSRLSFLSRDLTQRKDYHMGTEVEIDKAVIFEKSSSGADDKAYPENMIDSRPKNKTINESIGLAYCFSNACADRDQFDGSGNAVRNLEEIQSNVEKNVNSTNVAEKTLRHKNVPSNQTKTLSIPAEDIFDFSNENESLLEKQKLPKRRSVKQNQLSKQENATPQLKQIHTAKLTRSLYTDMEEQSLAETTGNKTPEIEDQSANVNTEFSEQSKEKGMMNEAEQSKKCTSSKTSTTYKKQIVKKSTAALNENFVSLNMKKKGYRRKGAAGLTAAQLRRKQWKQKMSARSASFGTNKCFKCGGEGHWANKCKGKSASKPDFAKSGGDFQAHTDAIESVEEADFPSLRQAALMARGTGKGNSAEKELDESDIADIEESIVRDRWEENDISNSQTPATIKPLSSIIHDLEEEVNLGLRLFGFTNFRTGQKDSIMRILKGLSTLVVLSTGAGKSLCYQLPAFLYAKHCGAVTLVISPLVSLMEDQITGLPAGVHGACLHSGMTQTQRDSVVSALKDGKVHFLLVSPEALVMSGTAHTSFPLPGHLPPIAFACIDEAHCLSEWSHNFRPSYLRLCKVLRSRYGVTCFLGLTATATRSTARDVAQHLGVGDDHAATVRGAAVPRNLVLSVSRDENKDEALINLLQGERFRACPSIIIYCSRREQTTRVATLIRTSMQTEADLGVPMPEPPTKKRRTSKTKTSAVTFDPAVWTAESYHAGLSAAKRKSVQKAFMAGRLRVVVATVAFGMGLDKPDVRAVIHYSMAKSFEAYVQEIGRAGRDGQTAHCHVFLDSENKDLSELRRHTFGNSVDRSALKKLVSMVFSPCRCAEICKRSANIPNTKRVAQLEGDQTLVTEELKQDDEQKTSSDHHQATCLCPGHERALSIEGTVKALDIKEEGVATLLCYLELHYPSWLEIFNNVYSLCNIRCYGGPAQLQAIAKKCPPVAVAVARQKLEGKSFSQSSELEFKVINVCDAMGWNSGLVKRELTALQWDSGHGGFRKSGVLVELSDLSFHFRSRGDLTDDQVDEVLGFLTSRTQRQEQAELGQLDMLADALRRVSHKNSWMCSEEADLARSDSLKKDLEDFFDRERRNHGDEEELNIKVTEPNSNALSQLLADIRQFMSIYGHDHSLSGRSIARILHGIASPNFPAEIWGRVRRFWRAHLHVDFPVVVREATKMVVAMR